MINDFGGGSFDGDMQQGNVFNSTVTAYVFYPPDYRRQEVGQTNGAWFTYKLNSGQYVLVNILENSGAQFYEIAPGVVSINCFGSRNTIIDTNIYVPYENVSAYVLSFFSGYTNANSLAYVKKFNKYSNSIDQGFLNIDPPTTTGFQVVSAPYGASANDFSCYNGSSGAYLGNLMTTPNAATTALYYNSASAGTYVFNACIPQSTNSSIDWRTGIIQLLTTTAIAYPYYYGYLVANTLSKTYQNGFILLGQRYLFDGERIYSVYLSGGDSGTIIGVPLTRAFANGMTFLAASPVEAVFLTPYDNTLYIFSGSNRLDRGQSFSNKSPITSAVYNVYEGALVMITTTSIITMRDSVETITSMPFNYGTLRNGIATENSLPYSYGTFVLESTDSGTYFVAPTGASIRSYYKISSASTIMPLDFMSAFFGMRDNQRMKVNRIIVYMLYESGTPSALTLNWRWSTQDIDGTENATVTPTANADGYCRFDWTPANDSVIGGAVEIVSADTTQKKVMLELVIQYNSEADANVASHAQ